MSTCNFSQPKLNYIYAFGLDTTDQFDFDCEYENIKEALFSGIKGLQESDKYIDKYTHAFASILYEFYDQDNKSWDGYRLYITIENGYYAGAKIDIDTDELPEVLNKTNTAKINAIKQRIERILTKHCQRMIRTAVFSNGEGIYKFI